MSHLEPLNKSYWLAKICESNYEKLTGLIPNLCQIPDCSTAFAEGKPSLLIRLLERSPYTLTLELTHSFPWEFGSPFEPALRIRVYLDAQAAEVLNDHERPVVLKALKKNRCASKILDYKWALNYFLSKWLDHCALCHYRFSHATHAAPRLDRSVKHTTAEDHLGNLEDGNKIRAV